MEQQIVEINDVPAGTMDEKWITSLEAGKVLYFRSLAFEPLPEELGLFTPAIRDPKSRNISLDANDRLKGAAGEPATQQALAAMMARFRAQAEALLGSLAPRYSGK